MKDNMNPCKHTLSNDVEYKEVVVIGNGPSGLVTSFMLAGNVPYLKEVPEDLPIDEMLRARLENLPKDQSLYETDLVELAEGLEGRSQNPIPLLVDTLLRPCADMGIEADPLIEWKYEAEKQVDHVVLGRGPPGGAWHTFPPTVRTLSPGGWLWLPPLKPPPSTGRLSAAAVAKYCRRYVQACNLTRFFRNNCVVNGVRRAARCGKPCGTRCPRAARYWVTGYDMSAGRMFRYLCARVVVASGGGSRANTLPPVAGVAVHSLPTLQAALQYTDRRLPVLVVGSGVSAADAVCAVGAAGRRSAHLHRGPPAALAALPPGHYPDYCKVYKMMSDGESGDYPLYKSYTDHAVMEVTRLPREPPPSNNPDFDHEIQEAVRPKRVKLLNMRTNETIEMTVSIIAVLIGSKPDLFFLQTNFNLNTLDLDECAKCNEEKKVKKKIEDDRRQCFFKNHWHYIKTVLGQSIQICKSRYLNSEINGNTDSECAIPDCNKRVENKCTCQSDIDITKSHLSINGANSNRIEDCLCEPTNPYSDGIGFGVDPKKPIEGRSNPVAIDKRTHEMLYAPKGVYALGPLTADNFVRFIPGGALAITAHIHKEKKMAAD